MLKHAMFGCAALALLAAALPAQEGGDLREQMKQLEARLIAVENDNQSLKGDVRRLADENAALKGELSGARDAGSMEKTVDQLSNSLSQDGGGTRVKSVANPITITGEFRFRYGLTLGDNAEFRTPRGPAAGFGLVDDEHDGTWGDFLMRVGMRYDFDEDVSAYSEFRARSGFGRSNSSSFPFGVGASVFNGTPTGQTQSTDLGDLQTFIFVYQTWLEVRNVFNVQELSTRTGRQEVILGNQFQFGNSEWFNGFAFDGTRWDYASDDWSVTALIFKLNSIDGDDDQLSSYFNSHDDDALFSLYFTVSALEDVKIDAYWIYVNGHGGANDNGSGSSIGSLGNYVGAPFNTPFGGGPNGTAYYHTLGLRLYGVISGLADGLDWNVEGAYQFGEHGKAFASDIDIGAGTVEAELGLTLDAESNFRIFTRFLYAAGPDDDEAGYTPLYANRHSNTGFRARYGLWDLIPMSNVFTPQLGFHVDANKDWTFGATGIWATTDSAGTMPATRRLGLSRTADVPSEDYGFEADLWAEYRHSDQLTIGGGLGLLFPDEAGERLWLVGDDVQLLAYLQMRLVF